MFRYHEETLFSTRRPLRNYPTCNKSSQIRVRHFRPGIHYVERVVAGRLLYVHSIVSSTVQMQKSGTSYEEVSWIVTKAFNLVPHISCHALNLSLERKGLN